MGDPASNRSANGKAGALTAATRAHLAADDFDRWADAAGPEQSTYGALARLLHAGALGGATLRAGDEWARAALRQQHASMAESGRQLGGYVAVVLEYHPMCHADSSARIASLVIDWFDENEAPWSKDIRARLGPRAARRARAKRLDADEEHLVNDVGHPHDCECPKCLPESNPQPSSERDMLTDAVRDAIRRLTNRHYR